MQKKKEAGKIQPRLRAALMEREEQGLLTRAPAEKISAMGMPRPRNGVQRWGARWRVSGEVMEG